MKKSVFMMMSVVLLASCHQQETTLNPKFEYPYNDDIRSIRVTHYAPIIVDGEVTPGEHLNYEAEKGISNMHDDRDLEFNRGRNLTSRTSYYADGRICTNHRWYYEQDRLVRVENMIGDTLTTYVVYTEGRNGLNASAEMFHVDEQEPMATVTYEYDDRGLEVAQYAKMTQYDFSSQTLSHYNAEGLLVRQEMKNGRDERISIIEYEDGVIKLDSTICIDEGDTLYIITEYNPQYLATRKTTRNGDEEKVETYEYTYDEHHNPISMVYRMDGEPQFVEIREYEYY